jgi:Uma2 family endonuclease
VAADPLQDGICLRIPTSAATLAGFRAWVQSDDFPEHVRAAFIGQEVYLDMSKEELETHSSVKTEVSRTVANLNRQRRLGKFYLDGVRITNKAARVSNVPDATFFLAESLRSGRVRLAPGVGKAREAGKYVEIVGTPDWVMEVISDSSVGKDTEKLRQAYHRAGIREYWLIDARGGEIVFQILYWRKTGYAAAPSQDGWQRSRVFGCSFRLERRRDELGLWEYTLHVQSA